MPGFRIVPGRILRYLCCLFLLVTGLVVLTAPQSHAALPIQVSFTLEGCDRPVGLTLPRPDGQFICPDADYGTGNQGPNWAELDLVPFRLTARITPAQTFTVVIAADARDHGVTGYDTISVPQLNAGLSGPSCQAPQVGAERTVQPGVGGTDASITRSLVIASGGDETCVYDWHQRLALGSAGFPGASLQTRVVNENLSSNGIGERTVSIPVNGIAPQTISKHIVAGRGDGFLWSVSKSSIPATVGPDTCLANPVTAFTTTISWTRTPVTGDVTWTSQIFATNPSSRDIQVRVTDVVRTGGSVIDTTTGQIVGVPALSSNVLVLEHSGTAPPGSTTVSDTATATYVDAETHAPVPGDTTATASSPVTVVAAGNPTAHVTDVTIGSQPIALDALTSGSVDVPLGTFVTRPITWMSGTVGQSGSATLTFSVSLPARFAGEATVQDTSTLRDTAGRTVTAAAAASVIGQPSPPRIMFIKNVDVAPTEDATFYFSLWLRNAAGDKTTVQPVLDGPVTIPAGATSSASIEVTVPPSPNGYIYEENPAPGYVTPPPGTLQAMDVCDSLNGVVENARQMGTIEVTKVVDGPTVGADPAATIVVNCSPGATYDETLNVQPGLPVETGPIPTGTACTISEPDPPAGYQLVSISPSSLVVTEGPTPVAVTVTNERLMGQLTVTKTLQGNPAGAGTSFTLSVDCEPGTTFDRDVTLTVLPPATQASSPAFDIPVGLTCTVTEPTVPSGWALSGIAPGGGVVEIGTTPTEVTVTDARVQGSLVVQKIAQGSPVGADTAFQVDVSCSDGSTDTVTLDVDDTSADFATLGPIASGATCTVTEPDVPGGGWALVDVVPSPVVIGNDADHPVTVTVTNRRETGHIDIVKHVDGPIAGATQNFTVHVECPGALVSQDLTMRVPGDDGSTTATVGGIPTGVECTVTEPDPPMGWTLTSIEPSPVTVSSTPQTVTVTNTRETGALTVVKRLDGDVAGAETTFTMRVQCPDAGVDQQVLLTVTDGVSASQTIGNLPTGVACTVTEEGIPDGWTLGLIEPNQVEIGTGAPARITVTNERETGGIAITKSIVGPVAGASTTFSAFLDCAGTAYDQPVSLTLSEGVTGTVLITGIPTGTACEFTEVNIPSAWNLGGVASNDVSIEGIDLVEITAVNVRRVGELRIVKRISGPEPDHGVSFDLLLDCADDVFDTAVPVDIGAGTSHVVETFSGIPTGVTCRVEENTLPAGWKLVSIDPPSATIAETPSTITVVDAAVIPGPPKPTPTPPTGSGQTPPPPGGGELPGTGSRVSPWLVLAALGLILVGGCTLAISRRGRRR